MGIVLVVLAVVVGALAAAVGYLLSQLRNKPTVTEEREPEVRLDAATRC